MEVGEGKARRIRVSVAFAALACLEGPVRSYEATVTGPLSLRVPLFQALSALFSGVVLLIVGRTRRRLDRPGWIAVIALAIPLWAQSVLALSIFRGTAWMQSPSWGVLLLLSVAAPLWLALLAATGCIRDEVPRAVAGASIAGIGAVLLVIPEDTYRFSANQIVVAILCWLLDVLVVGSWAFARHRLRDVSPARAAGWFLILFAVWQLGLACMGDQPLLEGLNDGGTWAVMGVDAAAGACMWWLWFWLLQRMMLSAFGMRALAAWVAALVPGFVTFGFLQWRIDAAVLIGIGAVVVALRARVAEEQPTALGLAGP